MISLNDFKKKQIVFVFTLEGDKLSFSNDNIVVKTSEGKIKHQSTCYRLFMVCIIGNLSITTEIIKKSKKYMFSIVLMTTSLKVYEIIGGRMEGNILLRKKQYSYVDNKIGALIIQNKLFNQKRALQKIRQKNSFLEEAIELIDNHIENLEFDFFDYKSIMGIEGSAARTYFSNIFPYYDWTGRKPRIKRDFINSTLDIGYTMLFNFLDAIVGIYGFDPFQGVLHRNFYMRKSLICDIIEPFRPIIDYQVRKAINLGQCKEEDFKCENGQYILKYEKNAEYVSIFLKAILDKKEEIFSYIQSYYRAFMRDKKIEEYPFYRME